MQIISTDKRVRNDTIQDLKEFNSQSLSTLAKKGEQLVSMMPAMKKAFNHLGDDIVELSTENDALKNEMEIASLIMSRMKKQMNKNCYCSIPHIQIRIIVNIP